jgi:hypothetical protein
MDWSQSNTVITDSDRTEKGRTRANRNPAVIAAVLATLVFGIVALVLFRPSPEGLMMVELSDEFVGKARLNINGSELTEADGSPLKKWPQLRSVKVGRATVMIIVPGYEMYVQTIDIAPGGATATLTPVLVKKSSKSDRPTDAPDAGTARGEPDEKVVQPKP